MKYSIIIPAHNEERFIGGCFESISRAVKPAGAEYEIVVVANRCTDLTADIAEKRGAKVVINDDKCLSMIRNAGVRASSGDAVITIDADSRMSDNMLMEIHDALSTGRYIGGGVAIKPERMSLGIFISILILDVALFFSRLSGGLYWCMRKDFDAVGGFDERLLMAEDLDFAKRLREYGKGQGKRFIRLRSAHIITSCRKFDAFGDWLLFRNIIHAGRIRKGFRGEDRTFPDKFFYDFNNRTQKM